MYSSQLVCFVCGMSATGAFSSRLSYRVWVQREGGPCGPCRSHSKANLEGGAGALPPDSQLYQWGGGATLVICAVSVRYVPLHTDTSESPPLSLVLCELSDLPETTTLVIDPTFRRIND